jgi:hypothetical protein
MKSDTLIARRDYALARTSSESRKENERERECVIVLSSPILAMHSVVSSVSIVVVVIVTDRTSRNI